MVSGIVAGSLTQLSFVDLLRLVEHAAAAVGYGTKFNRCSTLARRVALGCPPITTPMLQWLVSTWVINIGQSSHCQCNQYESQSN